MVHVLQTRIPVSSSQRLLIAAASFPTPSPHCHHRVNTPVLSEAFCTNSSFIDTTRLAPGTMSRLYVTASMPHKNWSGLAVPTLSVETNDHTGGGIHYGGLHPSSIAALLGKGPDVKKGERFDFKFNINVSTFIKKHRVVPFLCHSSFGTDPSFPTCRAHEAQPLSWSTQQSIYPT